MKINIKNQKNNPTPQKQPKPPQKNKQTQTIITKQKPQINTQIYK